MKPTKDRDFSVKEGVTGIMVGFTQEEIEILAYYCPRGTSIPSWIKKTMLKEIEDSGYKEG